MPDKITRDEARRERCDSSLPASRAAMGTPPAGGCDGASVECASDSRRRNASVALSGLR